MRICVVVGFVLTLTSLDARARQTPDGRLEGIVLEEGTSRPIPSATIRLTGKDPGTVTDDSGRFVLQLAPGLHHLSIGAIGYETVTDSIRVESGELVRRVFRLRDRPVEMGEVVVPADRPELRSGRFDIDVRAVESNPSPLADGLRILKTLPGVTTNTELSSGYSVRGGGTNENLVLIQGFEVFRPLRIRRGEQEGLSPVNPLLLERMTFLASGLPAEYGGKLSSALEVDYIADSGESRNAAAYISLLDAGAAYRAGAGDGGTSWVVGIRSSHPGRFLGTQETKGVYDPLFLDAQTALRVPLGRHHSIGAIGIATLQSYRLRPLTRTAVSASAGFDYATIESTRYAYSGRERSGYRTLLAGVRLDSRFSDGRSARHALAFYATSEYDESNVASVADMTIQVIDLKTGERQEPLFVGRFSNLTAIDNTVSARLATAEGRYVLARWSSVWKTGWTARVLRSRDDLDELDVISAITRDTTFIPSEPDEITIVDSTNVRRLKGRSRWAIPSVGGFVQRTGGVPGGGDRLILHTGTRIDWNVYSDQVTLSPRVRLDVRFGTTLWSLAWGVYHQAPGYAEYRGNPEAGSDRLQDQDRDLRSQRASNVSIGVDRDIGDGDWRYRAEAYYRRLTDLISYDVEDARVDYSGHNDSDGCAWGLDLQIRGEPVAGLDTWFSYGFLITRERYREAYRVPGRSGLVPRPADQRHTLSWFVQDRFRGRDDFFVNLRLLLGSGYPYTRPFATKDQSIMTRGNLGVRNASRYGTFFRVDIGTTFEFVRSGDLTGNWSDTSVAVDIELLNMFDAVNTIDYTWVLNDDLEYEGIPRRLTPRTFNVRLKLRF